MACESTWGLGLFAKNKKFLATLTVTGTGGGLGPVPPSPPAPSPQPRAGGQGAGGRRLSAVGWRWPPRARCLGLWVIWVMAAQAHAAPAPGCRLSVLGHLGHGRARDPNDPSRAAGGMRLGALGHLGHFVTGKKSVRLFSMRRALCNGCMCIQYIFYH